MAVTWECNKCGAAATVNTVPEMLQIDRNHMDRHEESNA